MRRKKKQGEVRDDLFHTDWSRYLRPKGILKEPIVIDREIYNGILVKRVIWLPTTEISSDPPRKVEFYTNARKFNEMVSELQELVAEGKEIDGIVEKALQLLSRINHKTKWLHTDLRGGGGSFVYEDGAPDHIRNMVITLLEEYLNPMWSKKYSFFGNVEFFLSKHLEFLTDIAPTLLALNENTEKKKWEMLHKKFKWPAFYRGCEGKRWPVFYLGFLQKRRSCANDDPNLRSDYELWWPFIKGIYQLVDLKYAHKSFSPPEHLRGFKKVGRPEGRESKDTEKKIEILRITLAKYPDKSNTFICEKAAEVLEEEIAQEIRELEKKIEKKEERGLPGRHIKKDRENLRKLKDAEKEGIDPESLRRRYLKEAKLRLGQ